MGKKWVSTSVAISAIWIAVLFVSLFARVLTAESAGGDRIEITVASLVVALFVLIATIVVAGVWLARRRNE
jgi:hypothetical protein